MNLPNIINHLLKPQKWREVLNRSTMPYFKTKVTKVSKELGGTMPENLPTPKRSIKQLASKQKKLESQEKDSRNEE
jgi:hypothetical protein